MSNRSILFSAAVAMFGLAVGLPSGSSAAPGLMVKSGQTALAQAVDYRKRRHYYRDYDGEHVRAPFASVDTGRATHVEAPFTTVHTSRYGTYVRAPFVDLWVPR